MRLISPLSTALHAGECSAAVVVGVSLLHKSDSTLGLYMMGVPAGVESCMHAITCLPVAAAPNQNLSLLLLCVCSVTRCCSVCALSPAIALCVLCHPSSSSALLLPSNSDGAQSIF